MLIRSLALLAAGTSAVFAQTQPPLMPRPANVSVQPGAVTIDTNFTISTSGAGASDPRVTIAVQQIFARLARQTGIPLLPHIVHTGDTATLSIVVEQKDHRPPQRLGDDERYSLEASNYLITLSRDHPLGIILRFETFRHR